MSRVIKLAGVSGFTGGQAVPVDRDILLGAGTLISIEPGHPTNGWEGVPAHNTAVPNLAAAQCNALVGTGAADLTFQNEFTTAEGIVELSGKGGLHVIKKQAGGQTAGRAVRISMSTALRAYLAAHPTHDIYISWWGKRTRAGLPGSVIRYIAKISGTGSGQFTAAVGVNPILAPGAGVPSDARRLGYTDNHGSDLYFIALASTGTSSDFGGTVHPNVFLDGLITSGDFAVSPSFLTYALTVDVLTVSGRTFQQLEALDHALYTAMVRTPGGKYYDDTYTDPATV